MRDIEKLKSNKIFPEWGFRFGGVCERMIERYRKGEMIERYRKCERY